MLEVAVVGGPLNSVDVVDETLESVDVLDGTLESADVSDGTLESVGSPGALNSLCSTLEEVNGPG